MSHKMLLKAFILVISLSLIAGAHVNLTNPTGGENFTPGDPVTIEWVIVIDHGDCVWDLYFSDDGGATWNPIAENLPKAQLSYSWTVPDDPTGTGEIRVVQDNAIDPDYESASGDFTILPTYDFYVEVGDFYFSPETLHVDPGQTVRWENVSPSINHTTTANGGLWDSGNLAPGEYYEFTFDSVGSFDYICTYHPVSMTGQIIVDAPVITPEQVQIMNFAFNPADLTINLGDSVRWTNDDAASHTSTSDDGVWDSGTLNTGQSFTYIADTAGVFPYHCTIHPSMLGTLTVLDTVISVTYEYVPGDANMPNGTWPPAVIGSDVTYLVNFFRGLGQACNLGGFYAAADVNGDCNVIGSDVTRLVNFFRGQGSLSHCEDYPPAWETPPMDPPPGWPNCD